MSCERLDESRGRGSFVNAMNSLSTEPRADARRVSMRRIAGLDGLRAIAAILVLVYHLIPGWADIGYVGVDVFFVLSGFLITSLLIVSVLRNGKVKLGDFWARRFRRLFPAVFVATIGVAALAFLSGGDALVGLGRQVLGSLTATYNWIEIGHGASYFEEASPLLLTNMWSLAVEQQFYLVWPLLVVLLVMLPRSLRVLSALAIAAGSIALHLHLLTDDVTRVYMGTDTHLWGLMFGAALAFAMQRVVVQGDQEPANEPDLARSRLSWLWGIASWIGLFGIIVGGLLIENSSAMYPWGMVGASLLALLVVRAMLPDVVSAPKQALEGLLGSRVLTWLGVRSYGIYLWHWPLYVIAYYRFPLVNPYLVAAGITALSILAADLSYRYVENPIRIMGVRGWFRHVRDSITDSGALRAITIVALPLVVFGLAGAGIATAPATSTGQQAVEAGNKPNPNDPAPDGSAGPQPPAPAPGQEPENNAPGSPSNPPAPTNPAPTQTPGDGAPGEVDPTVPEDPETDEPEPAPTKDPNAPYPESWDQVTIIGDSVTLAAQYSLQDSMPGVRVDAAESRSIQVAHDIVAQYEATGELGEFVVVSLATNGSIKDYQIQSILDTIGPDRTLVLVTGFGPARANWIPEANEAIFAMAEQYPDRIRVADWHAAIEDHTDLLAGDVTHPGREGADLFAATVRHALEP